ncbi:MAG: MFS transporter, partial [Bacteroidota bacterium]
GMLIYVGLFYAISAFFSAIATTFTLLIIARMLGGLAVGAALILAPMYIAELVPAEQRGRMVSINQLNIVLGFSAAYFANYFILQLSGSDAAWVQTLLIDRQTWRWMLGIELIPALLYFVLLLKIPESPRWLLMQQQEEEAQSILTKVYGPERSTSEMKTLSQSIANSSQKEETSLKELFQPALKLVLTIGIIIGVLQQITGVNAIYFYAPSIFEQSGIGTDAAFAQAIWVGIINVVFTIVAMSLIDKMGRKPLLLIGVAGIAVSMFIAAFGFSQATYNLSIDAIGELPPELDKHKVNDLIGFTYESDVAFKHQLRERLTPEEIQLFESDLLKAAVRMNPLWILLGILGFVASFAISLGPVMWVLFAELFPNWIRGIAISFVGFINSMVSFGVQLVFPWELTNLGSALTFGLYGLFALIGLFLIQRLLPETKGKSLEEIEKELIG